MPSPRDQVRDQLHARGLHEVEHARAVALAGLDQAHVLERLDRLAQRRAVDPELLRQLALGWELVADRVLAAQDEPAELLDDFFRNSRFSHRSEHRTEMLHKASRGVGNLKRASLVHYNGGRRCGASAAIALCDSCLLPAAPAATACAMRAMPCAAWCASTSPTRARRHAAVDAALRRAGALRPLSLVRRRQRADHPRLRRLRRRAARRLPGLRRHRRARLGARRRRRRARTAEVALLDAGTPRAARPARSRPRITPHHYPELVPFVSGVVYGGDELRRSRSASASPTQVTGDGGEEVGPFNATRRGAAQLPGARPSTRCTAARDLDVRWSTDATPQRRAARPRGALVLARAARARSAAACATTAPSASRTTPSPICRRSACDGHGDRDRVCRARPSSRPAPAAASSPSRSDVAALQVTP